MRYKNFILSDDPTSYDTGLIFYARVDPAITKAEDLLSALYYQLWLPPYFGFNWNSLDECLRNLEWIDRSRVVLVHELVPKMDALNTKTHLEVLLDSSNHWITRGEPRLEVVFPTTEAPTIQSVLSDFSELGPENV
jgi:hypothetical protein